MHEVLGSDLLDVVHVVLGPIVLDVVRVELGPVVPVVVQRWFRFGNMFRIFRYPSVI